MILVSHAGGGRRWMPVTEEAKGNDRGERSANHKAAFWTTTCCCRRSMDPQLLLHFDVLRNATFTQAVREETVVTQALEAIFASIDNAEDETIAANAGSNSLLQTGLVEVLAGLVAMKGHSPYIYHLCFGILSTLVIPNDHDDKSGTDQLQFATLILAFDGIQGAIDIARTFARHEMLMTTVMSFFYVMTNTLQADAVGLDTELSRQVAASVLGSMDSWRESADVYSFGCATLTNLCRQDEEVYKVPPQLFDALSGALCIVSAGIVRYTGVDPHAQLLGRKLLFIVVETCRLCSTQDYCSAAA